MLGQFLLVLLLVRCALGTWTQPDNWARPGKDLTRADLIKIAALPDIDVFWDDLLDPLLVSRTVGSVGHDNVRKHLTDHFEALGWASAVDQFNAITPLGALTFRNLIFTLDPTKPRRFVLAAHYDSKFFESQTFIGASDSAVPCAMIMHLVSILDTALKVAQADELSVRNDTTLEIVFFDGEEAFEKWTATDSIYGARHLAAVWESRNAFACSGTDGAGDAHCDVASPDGELQSNDGSANGTSGSNYTVLQGIEVFMLLDLIGGTRPTFHSFDPSTDFLFMRLIDLENKLGSFQQLSDTVGHPYFQPISNSLSRPQIGDDHTPFAERNVPIAHLIQWPFPKFWHKLEDNESIIDPDATMDMMRVLAAFLAEYFHLSV